MRIRLLSPILLSLAVLLPNSMTLPAKAAGSNDYFCAQLKGVWTTWVKQPSGRASALIRWKSDNIKGWSPRQRCIAVSGRIQGLSDNGVFNYVTAGTLQRQTVLCGVRSQGEDCTDRNLILTLPPGADPDQAIERLLDVSARARGQVMVLSGDKNDTLANYVNGQTYINMEAFKTMLQKAETPVSITKLTPVK